MKAGRGNLRGASVVLLALELLSSVGCEDTTNPPPEVLSVTPDTVSAGIDTPIQVSGRNFFAAAKSRADSGAAPSLRYDFKVRLTSGDTVVSLPAIFVDTETLSLTVPEGMRSGSYDVTVITPTGLDATLAGGLKVVGVPVEITLEDAPGGAGAEVQGLTVTTDDVVDLYAVSRDQDGAFVADEPVTWTLLGDIVGLLSQGPAPETSLDLFAPGFAGVRATHATLGEKETGIITVHVGAPARAVIVSASGSEIGGLNLSVDSSLPVFAIGRDADSNDTGSLDVAWSVTHEIGTLDATGVASHAVFTPTKAGVGQIVATPTTAEPDATGNLTIIAGTPVRVAIVNAPNGAGTEIDTHHFFADDPPYTFFAVGLDAGDNYSINVPVTWAWSGGCPLGGLGANTTGPSVTFTPSVTGACTLTAGHAFLTGDSTGTIEVTPGALAGLLIVDSVGNKVTTLSMQSGDQKDMRTVGLDRHGNRLDPVGVNVSWTTRPTSTALSPTTGDSTRFTAGEAGSWQVEADVAEIQGSPDAQTDSITVSPGPVASISIETAADGSGQPFGSVNVLANQSLLLFAVARDAAGNVTAHDYSAVQWALSPTSGFGNLSAPSGPSVLYTAGGTAGNATVTAIESGIPRSTHDSVNLIIVTGSITTIYISDTQGTCSNWTPGSVTTDFQVTLYAVGCNGTTFVAGVNVDTWALTNPVGSLSSSSGTSTRFDANTPGSSARITVTDALGNAQTPVFSVTLGRLATIIVRRASNGGGNVVGDLPGLHAGDSRTWFAAGYDTDGNYITDEIVNWSVVAGNHSAKPGFVSPTTDSSTTTFTATKIGSGYARADYSANDGVADGTTGTLTVAAGSMTVLSIEDADGGGGQAIGSITLPAGQTRLMYTVGRDAYGNFVGPVTATWAVTGGIGSVGPTQPWTSTEFTATTAGDGWVTAVDQAGAPFGQTGQITVKPGPLARVVIHSGAGNLCEPAGDFSACVGDKIPLDAYGCDDYGNVVLSVSPLWRLMTTVPDIGTLIPSLGPSTMFKTTAAGSGRIYADDSGSGFSTSTGTITVQSNCCGNGIREGSEICDPGPPPDLAQETCLSQGYLNGTSGLACNNLCTGFNFTGCGRRIDTVAAINEALDQAYHGSEHDVISVWGGNYQISTALIVNECLVADCSTSTPPGVTLQPVPGTTVPVLLIGNCMLGDTVVMQILSPNNTIRGLSFLSCAGAITIQGAYAVNNLITHNLFSQVTARSTVDLVYVQSPLNTIEANRFVATYPNVVRAAIYVNGTLLPPANATRIGMNAIYGAMTYGVYMTGAGPTGPSQLAPLIDHNSVWFPPGLPIAPRYGMYLSSVTGLCFRNNVLAGPTGGSGSSGASGPYGLYLDSTVVLGSTGPCGPTVAQKNDVLNFPVRCTGNGCTPLCYGPSGGSGASGASGASGSSGPTAPVMCDLYVDPGFTNDRLCLSQTATQLIDQGVSLAPTWDMLDDVPNTYYYSGSKPEVGAREQSATRVFGGYSSSCNGVDGN